ncbi:Protein croquemort, partial [Eufriesea mexicana]
QELPLTPTSKAFEVWNDTSSLPPMYLKIRFFNWTNPDELRMDYKKPNVVEVGPYVFREVRQKVNVSFNPENHTVSYFNRRWWYYEPELTNGSLTDRITQLNIVAISAKHKIRYWNEALQGTLSLMLSTSNVHISKTVDELLFTGYDDSLIEMGRMVSGEDIPPFDKFGWFYMMNGSTTFDGNYNMATGTDDIGKFGSLKNWNYRDTTKFFKSPCNVVEGSAGEFWPPYRQRDEIMLYSGDLCRPLTYEYEQTVDYLGLDSYRYVLGEKTLGNSTRRRYPHEQAKYFEQTTTTEDFFEAEHSVEATDPPEEDPDVVNIGNCYCNGKCTPAGLMNVSSCRYGAPVFASLPHFNRADPSLREAITGLNPDDDHDFSITLEPRYIPLSVSAKLQINILLEESKIVSLFRSVPTIYFPVMWFSLEVEATDQFVGDLKKLLAIPNVCICTGLIMIVVGCLVDFTMILLYLLNKQRANPIPADKNSKKEVVPSAVDKSELIYLNQNYANEDMHVRGDRRLYAGTIETYNPEAQKLQSEK